LKRWSSLLVLSLSIMSAPLPAYAADEKISPEARGYFRNGVELLQNDPPNYQDAYYQFKLAFEKSQSWKVLGNLGLCAVKLERDGEALAFYDEYLRRGGKQIDKEEREAIERDMLLIKGNGATLELTSKVSPLKIQDTRSGSTAAAQSHEMTDGKKTLFVRAGAHHLTVTASDGRSLVWDATIEPGSTVNHDFDFDAPVSTAAEAPQGSANSPPPRAAEPPPHYARAGHNTALTTIGFVTGGAGILGLGGGVVTGLMAQSKEQRAKDRCDPNRVCDPSAQPLFSEASDMAKTSTILYVAGGSLAAIGLGLVIVGYSVSGPSDEARSNVTLVPVLTADGGGLFAAGKF
jgi:hypothetical protein